ncbi:Methyltransferase str3 [Mycena sanguinolenta]|uniref:Methyltransferase str3 n=1 Tax=Mycena sanguinolenta TaxID=230812 RepID=A0A8H6XZN1_9AGAR|nr:Methyltransferase str3 [Mycena sanguinolenta]
MASISTEYPLIADGAEWERLDAMHNGIANYLDHKLSPADLGQPRKILEIGSGSGAWAFQAAEAYPDADVLAIDINPLPPRPLPSNVRFERIDIMDPFPFSAGSFDVVHARMVLCHLTRGITALPRIIDLVAPGGWLLIDEVDFRHETARVENAPGVKGGFTGVVTSMKSHQGDPHFGKILRAALERSNAFSEININLVDVPMNPTAEVRLKDPALEGLSKTMPGGLTREVQQAFIAEMGAEVGGDWSYSVDMYFSWARKRIV